MSAGAFGQMNELELDEILQVVEKTCSRKRPHTPPRIKGLARHFQAISNSALHSLGGKRIAELMIHGKGELKVIWRRDEHSQRLATQTGAELDGPPPAVAIPSQVFPDAINFKQPFAGGIKDMSSRSR